MSGLAKASYHVGPRELNVATSSSDLTAVPCVNRAPTVMADGALPGEVTPAYPGSPVTGLIPQFPAAATTTSPARVACSIAWTRGSDAADSKIG